MLLETSYFRHGPLESNLTWWKISVIVRAGFLPFEVRLWRVPTELMVLTKIPLSCQSLISEFQSPSPSYCWKLSTSVSASRLPLVCQQMPPREKLCLSLGIHLSIPSLSLWTLKSWLPWFFNNTFKQNVKKKKIHLALLVVSSGRVNLE